MTYLRLLSSISNTSWSSHCIPELYIAIECRARFLPAQKSVYKDCRWISTPKLTACIADSHINSSSWDPQMPDPRSCFLERLISEPPDWLVYPNADKFSAQKSWDALGELGELVKPTATNRADFIQECRDGKYDGVVAAYRTYFSVAITGPVDEELVNALPSSLQYIAHCGMAQYRPSVQGTNLP